MAKRKSPKKVTRDVSTSESAQPDTIDATAVDVSETPVDAPESDATPLETSNDDTLVSDEPAKAQTEVGAEAPEAPEESPAPENSYFPELTPVQPEPQRASVLPLIFAGILTAVLGFMAARSDFLPESLRAPTPQIDPAIAQGLADVTNRLAALEASVAEKTDLEPIGTKVDALSERSQALTDRVDALAARPQVDINVPQDALDAALAELRETASQQQAEIDKLLADARLIRTDTQAEANATLKRAALTRIMSAVDTGSPFASALGDLEQAGETDVPDALKSAATDGVTSLAALQETFPDAARSSLAAARNNSKEESGLSGFLQRQLGTRSIEPREGSDPDAVLSRMEAAMRAGRLGDALAEVEQLPDPARDAMATWLEQAQSRYDTVSAANALADRLSAL